MRKYAKLTIAENVNIDVTFTQYSNKNADLTINLESKVKQRLGK